jgi:ribonuclease BN (tRNA processing enzyme)
MTRTSVTFLGTGTAFNQDGRASQAFLVRSDSGTPFLVDAGPTMMVHLMREGAGYADVDRLFLTHLHGDHVAGWPFLLLHMVILERRERPFDVYGPPGTRELLEDLARLCYADVLELQRFEVRYHELEVAVRSGLAVGEGLSLDTLPMRHHPSSIGLRFRVPCTEGERVIGVTGDTGWCDGLEQLARGCDLLLLECTSVDPLVDSHVSLTELRERAGRLESRQVVLVHLTDAVARSLSIDPIPRVATAFDGMEWEIGGHRPADGE